VFNFKGLTAFSYGLYAKVKNYSTKTMNNSNIKNSLYQMSTQLS